MIGRQATAPDLATRSGAVRPLPIGIHAAAGHGSTLLSAFDAALLGAGVANYNLVRLSSVIPRQAVIEREAGPVVGEHGDRLYCVYAAAYADRPGASAWAGIGWVRDEEGNGLFVEHETGSEEELMELIHLSLDDMKAEDTLTIDLRGKSALADTMVVSSGRSNRHVGSIADRVVENLGDAGVKNIRVEGTPHCDWVLIDAGDVIVHVFRPEVREFYAIEKMWAGGKSAARKSS